MIPEANNFSDELVEKIDRLETFLSGIVKDGIIVAFSGGVDSAMLLWASKRVLDKVGGRLLAVTQNSISLPRKDFAEAVEFTKSLEIEHQVVEGKEFNDQNYLKNDLNRCYYCRKDLFRITGDFKNDGYANVLYGYNHSDKGDLRPGHKAAIENDILSPLAKFNFTKDEIRLILRTNNIEIADKPATPCLSSRIMTGIKIEENDIRNIEELEKILWDAGAKIFRVRISKDEKNKFIRIEASENDLNVVLEQKNRLVLEGKKRGYKWITLDLEGYKLGGGVSFD